MVCCFFFNETATTEIYSLSLHDALPISSRIRDDLVTGVQTCALPIRSEEHTSELQSPDHLVCRLLLVSMQLQLGVTFPIMHMIADDIPPDTFDNLDKESPEIGRAHV